MATKTQNRHAFARHVAPFAPVALALAMNAVPKSNVSPAKPSAETEMAEPSTPGFVQMCPNPTFPPDSMPIAIDNTSCTIAGNGGAETFQNEAKNNFCAIGPAKVITIPDMIALQGKVQQDGSVPFGNSRNHPLTVKAGPAIDRKPLEALGEGSEVTLQGFVNIARQEGAESVNCGSHVPNADANHDIHISIVSSSDQKECSGVVVEMIPHHRPASWNADNVNTVAKAKLLVRVNGQLMFDSSHTPCQNGQGIPGDPKRASLWEVHPVYSFDVCPAGNCSGGTGWVPLEEFLQP